MNTVLNYDGTRSTTPRHLILGATIAVALALALPLQVSCAASPRDRTGTGILVDSVSSGRSSTASSRDWKVTLWVARTTTKVGTTIPAIVTVDNRTGHSIEISGCPGTTYEIVLGNSKIPNEPIIPWKLCVSPIAPGVHVFHTRVQTTYQSCGGTNTTRCGNPPKIPALPAGSYRTQLILPGGTHQLPMPKALTITLTS